MSEIKRLEKLIRDDNAETRTGFVTFLKRAIPRNFAIRGKMLTKKELEDVWNNNTSISEMAAAINKIAKIE